MKSSALTLAASAAFFVSAMPALAATVIFDDFTDVQVVIDEPFQGTVNTSTIDFGDGTRTLTVENTNDAGQGGTTFAATLDQEGTGGLSFSNNQGATGIGTLTYTSVGDIDDGSVDPFFFFAVDTFDGEAFFTATALDTFGISFTYEETISGLFDPFLSFSEFAGVDFNSIDTLTFTISSGTNISIDGRLTSISVSAVPLPAAGFLLIAGLGGLAALRRKKRA